MDWRLSNNTEDAHSNGWARGGSRATGSPEATTRECPSALSPPFRPADTAGIAVSSRLS